jgi:hypothetical protein
MENLKELNLQTLDSELESVEGWHHRCCCACCGGGLLLGGLMGEQSAYGICYLLDKAVTR